MQMFSVATRSPWASILSQMFLGSFAMCVSAQLLAADTPHLCIGGHLEDCEVQMMGITHAWRDFGFGEKFHSSSISETVIEYLARDVVRTFLNEIDVTCEFLLSVSGSPPLVKIANTKSRSVLGRVST